MKRLAVIPNDPLEEYKKSGYIGLEQYYNPRHFFDEVYALSPLEKEAKEEYGMRIIPTKFWQMKKRIRELRIDVVRAYGGYWPAKMACDYKVSGVPAIVSVHDTNPERLCSSIKKADCVFCVSQAVRNLVLTKFKDPQRAWVLPNRVDFNLMRPHDNSEFTKLNQRYPFKYRILHVGRQHPVKNLDTLIKALKILGDEYCVIAAGSINNLEDSLLAHREGVWQRCFFIGPVRNDELPLYYSWCDCMCTPSRREAFGVVFIEALACASAVVTSDIAAINEYMRHMYNGLLVKDYENPLALAEAVKLACTDSKVRSILKSNARKSVEQFEKSKIDALELDYYQQAMELGISMISKARLIK